MSNESKMASEDDLLKKTFIIVPASNSPDGTRFVIAVEDFGPSMLENLDEKVVFSEGASNRSFFNLLAASQFMFKALHDQIVWFDKLMIQMRNIGIKDDDPLFYIFTQLRQAAFLAKECAVNGTVEMGEAIVEASEMKETSKQ